MAHYSDMGLDDPLSVGQPFTWPMSGRQQMPGRELHGLKFQLSVFEYKLLLTSRIQRLCLCARACMSSAQLHGSQGSSGIPQFVENTGNFTTWNLSESTSSGSGQWRKGVPVQASYTMQPGNQPVQQAYAGMFSVCMYADK